MIDFDALPAIEAGAKMPTGPQIMQADMLRRKDAERGSRKLLRAWQMAFIREHCR